MTLDIVPVSFADACAFITEHHRQILIDGAWRGPRMPDHVIAARFGSRHAPESAATAGQAPENPSEAPVVGPADSEGLDGRTA